MEWNEQLYSVNLFFSNIYSNKESPDYASMASSDRSRRVTDDETASFPREEIVDFNSMEDLRMGVSDKLERRAEPATIALTATVTPSPTKKFQLGLPLEVLFRITEFLEPDEFRILEVLLTECCAVVP